MGLFDRLFGKKKQEETNHDVPVSENQSSEITEALKNEKENETTKLPEVNEEPVKVEKVTDESISKMIDPEPEIPAEPVSENEPIISENVEVEVTDEKVSSETTKVIEKKVTDEDEEEEIVIDIDALANIFTQSREETEKKYEQSLTLTRKTFSDGFNELFANFRTVDEEFFEELEETLIMSDVGVDLAMEVTEELRKEAKLVNAKSTDDLRQLIIEKIVDKFDGEKLPTKLNIQTDGLSVFLFVGVNGVGKTTTIGKLAARYKNEGKKVLLAAADTFRAGAIDQLVEWGNRSGVEVVTKPAGSDPAAVVFDALAKAKAENYDILLVDTAGRLQNKDNLMKELEKIGKVIKREIPDAPHETILALDATTGQNAIQQAKEFSAVTPITGIALTKLDGSAKGGIVLSIVQSLKIPVKLIGLGEKLNDLQDFEEEFFVRGLFKELL
ncbi:signal recognition particle-docking protein FtsY [Lactococcus sp. NH2-7C]|uniref:signal recognition particle-docking protein FtsY n=1 Tax=Lactococcus sp. NH2-7C TaxID=2879149 RepID=UPI001CDBB167|nr:signal recognition particle-docking protein FtsY [Lactococcus sp. NH2-7C]MCA2389477.1 signal recognition particle-docking protein FtsY [Lactococcus sp. NH2-7C]WGV30162.1 signal recognition particle-docking protein FtsY [Lactococcus sp. NH2-7C]